MKSKWFFGLLTLCCASLSLYSAEHVTLVSSNSVWRFFPGRMEASSPIEAWRFPEFDDSAFVNALAPFHVGEPSLVGTGTLLASPMEYTSIFLRKTFEITNVSDVALFRLHALYDDGFVVWINGAEVLRQSVPGFPGVDPVTYNTLASTTNEATGFLPFDLFNASTVVMPGTNLIAIQVFNVSSNSDDMVFDAAFEAILIETNPPTILAVSPPPGNSVFNLSNIVVQFSEQVFGVDASDLLINSNAATAVVSNAPNLYTFTFRPPRDGVVQVSWSTNSGISDELGNVFNATNVHWTYNNVDTVPPTVIETVPTPGSIVHFLNEVRITFSEPVRNVDATDLLLNGSPALNVVTQSPSVYVFHFARARPGPAEVAWVENHGITDVADKPSSFAGGSWTYFANRLPYSIFLNPNTNTVLVTFSNRFATGVCTVEGRDGRRWVPLVNFYTTQQVGQAIVTLPTNYATLRLVCMDISPGNSFTRLALAYGNIHTIAGKGEIPPGTNGWLPQYEGANATDVNLSNPRYALADTNGNIYVVERDGHAVDKITPDGKIHTFIGQHRAGFTNFLGGTFGTNELLNTPSGLWIAGNTLFVLDGGNNRVLATALSGNTGFTATVFEDIAPPTGIAGGIGTNSSGLWVGLDRNGAAEEAFYGVGKQVRHWELGEGVKIETDALYEARNVTVNPQGRTVAADPIAGQIQRVRNTGFLELIAGRGFSNRRSLGGDVEKVPLPGASSVWYLPRASISGGNDLGYFISLDQGATVWYVNGDDNAVPFIFGAPGVHAGDGEWFRKGGRKPKVSNVLSVTMTPAGHIILVEGNRFIRQIDFLRHRP